MIQIDEVILAVAHTEFLHVRQLAQAMTRFNPFYQIMVILFFHSIDQIDTGLVNGQDIKGCSDAYVRRHNRLGSYTFAVTGNGHVAHDIDISNVAGKAINRCFTRFSHPFHKFFLGNIPLVGLARCRMNHGFTNTAVGTADTDIFIGTTETTLCMALKVG